MEVLFVEDDRALRKLFAFLLEKTTGCPVHAFTGLEELAATTDQVSPGPIILVTDGDLKGGVTCESVLSHALEVFGVERLGRTCLIVSGDSLGRWGHVMEQGRTAGLDMIFLQKPVSLDRLADWWKQVRHRFV